MECPRGSCLIYMHTSYRHGNLPQGTRLLKLQIKFSSKLSSLRCYMHDIVHNVFLTVNNRLHESATGEQDAGGRASDDKVVGHFHPEERLSVSRIEALERELSETREAKERQEKVVRELQDELQKQCVSPTISLWYQCSIQQSS